MPATPLPDSLLLNGRRYAYRDIQQYPGHAGGDINGYEARVLDFCRQWLNGVQEFVLTTSGSTGPAQPITLKRSQLLASARRTVDYFGLGPGHRMLVCLNCEFIGGLMMLVRALEHGMHLTIVEPVADPFALLPLEADFDFGSLVPLQLRAVLAQGHAPRLERMRAILIGGAPLDHGLSQQVQALQVPLYHTYGMTETCSHVALRRLNGPEASEFYRVLPGLHVEQDARGCLAIRGDVTLQELVQTNDLVRFLEHDHSQFAWLGRADFVINSGGVKVPAEKVELVLEVALVEVGLSGRRAFVAGLPDERLGQQVTAIVEGDALPPAEETQLLELLRQRLGRYEVPRAVHYAPQFAQTASGKLNRRATLQALGLAANEGKLA
ncbi:AMP-binding protein [Hymenobacter busanensis]|uniref:AMP-binding protein n=1 Tax=Hymenobacter busanensis TaxID=2607656 RepID=A0A7L5A2T7_9BACT|nr:AMP-binding protein [Hymenobacter busanensis]KAA9327062.1 AMP-binding protein [Hymenobacter busanensis]QHJ09513.1 AMP-binding protein [Hymenobacter busanensis]